MELSHLRQFKATRCELDSWVDSWVKATKRCEISCRTLCSIMYASIRQCTNQCTTMYALYTNGIRIIIKRYDCVRLNSYLFVVWRTVSYNSTIVNLRTYTNINKYVQHQIQARIWLVVESKATWSTSIVAHCRTLSYINVHIRIILKYVVHWISLRTCTLYDNVRHDVRWFLKGTTKNLSHPKVFRGKLFFQMPRQGAKTQAKQPISTKTREQLRISYSHLVAP